MSRPTDWSPAGYDQDPVPGDPLAVSAAARRYRETATGINTAVMNLRRLDGSSLVSQAFKVAFERIRDVADKLESTESRVSGAASALDAYWPELERAQLDSLRALRAAEQERQNKRRHDSAVAALANAYNGSTDPVQREQLKQRYDRESAASREATHAVDIARGDISAAIAARDEAAAIAIHALDDADRESPVKDTPWDKAVDWFEKNILPTIKAVAESIAEFAKKYGTIIDIVGAVLAIAALFIPGFGPILFGVITAAFALFSIGLSSMTMLNAQFKFQEGAMTAEEFAITQLTETASIGLSVFAMATGGSAVLKAAAKPILKRVVGATIDAARDTAIDLAFDAGQDKAKRAGEERLHQERIQEEARMRQYIMQERRQGAASGDYYRRQVAPCYAGGM